VELLKLVGLEGDANNRVSHFSKGMKVRLGFVRALLNKPDLLFLDEPTTGLDPVNGRIIRDIILKKKTEGTTVFLTTHNMALADELCDRVAFIVDGEIKLTDSPRQLKLQHGKRVVKVEFNQNSHVETREFGLKGLGTNADFLDLLCMKDVQTIHTEEATLEDIFIKATGRNLA
jgi:fluoroquinolone transport system ATP-binding protein